MITTLPIYNQIFVVLIDLIAIWLAFIVYSNNPKGKTNKIFALMTLFMLLWVNFAFFARLFSYNTVLAKNFLRIAWFVTPLFYTTLYFLVINLIEKKYRVLNIFVLFVGIFLAVLTGFTDLVVSGTKVVDGILRIIYGPAMMPFLIAGTFLTLAILYPLFKNYLKARVDIKNKLEYFIAGSIFFYTANIIFNIILPMFYDIARFYFIGDYSTIFLLGFTAFAIIKQELFGIKVVLTQFLVGIIAIVLLTQAITSENLLDFAWKFIIFIVFVYFGFLLIKSVINEIKRRAELQKLYEEVDKLSKTKSEFISIASHQLRTPLTAVKGYISMIIEGSYGKPGKKLVKPLENVYESNERLIRLVNDLLNLSRLESGKIKLAPQIMSLEEMVISIVNELKINAENKGLYIKLLEPIEPLPQITADPDKLRQVVLNVVDNAIKYTKTGGITVEVNKIGSSEQVRVSDTGAGMDQNEINSLFQMFTRATAGTQLHTEGAGIGLYVARQFIEMHGGKIWAESKGTGQGSTFIIELPIK